MDEQEQQNCANGSLCRQLGDIGRYFLLVSLFVSARHAPYLLAFSPNQVSVPHSPF